MAQLVPWIQVTISGFVYVTALIFILLSLGKKHDLNFTNIREYLPYLAILIVFLSYVLGYATHLASQKIIFCFYPQFDNKINQVIEIQKTIPDILYKSYEDVYSDLIMLRHLVVATFLLGLSFYIWFRKSNLPQFKWYALSICVIFTTLFYFAYLMQKELLNKFVQIILNQ